MQINAVIQGVLQGVRDGVRTYPVTHNYDHNRVIGRATINSDSNIISIELSDPEIVAWIQKDHLLGLSIGKTYIPEKDK